MEHERIREHYEETYRERGARAFPREDSRTLACVRPLLARLGRGDRVLDVGCGVGYAASLLSDAGLGVAGVDISETAIALARERLPGAELVPARPDGRLPWGDGAFDGLVCLGVLEHVPAPEGVLAECRRVLRTGGTAVFVVPNSRSPYFLFGRGTGQVYEKPRTLAGWRALFAANGFLERGISRDPGPSFARGEGVARSARLAVHRVLNLLPIGLTYQLVFALEAGPVPAGGVS